ncbi:MAG: T9SS type A sorting domain-containing protein [Bacteroidetes bacterium]|nr:T9SS type A sorting domain-containing protein [Bacteroidota bacterium]MBU1679309.1 T9SS type A sorting domain-containing protein [Bacteroidota bacterium]MBU2508260.1 T9SS type A sorting domain-containing protein [Bacteroidota bacterium]
MKLFDLLGREVKLIIDREFSAGTHVISIEPGAISSAVYFVRMSTGQFQLSKKIVFLQ